MRPTLLVVLLGLVATTGCADDAAERSAANDGTIATTDSSSSVPLTPAAVELAEAQAVWAGSKTSNYQYESTATLCECALAGSLRVEVAESNVVQIVRRDSPAAEYYELDVEIGYTVEDLFAMIDEAIGLEILNSVEYHPELGYPTAIDIGPDSPDGRMVFELTSFTATG